MDILTRTQNGVVYVGKYAYGSLKNLLAILGLLSLLFSILSYAAARSVYNSLFGKNSSGLLGTNNDAVVEDAKQTRDRAFAEMCFTIALFVARFFWF